MNVYVKHRSKKRFFLAKASSIALILLCVASNAVSALQDETDASPQQKLEESGDEENPEKIFTDQFDRWSKDRFQRFSLYKHLTTPTRHERHHGIHDHRRLSHNLARLGIPHDNPHPDVVNNPPRLLVERFGDSGIVQSVGEGQRLRPDGLSPSLPFRTGPGVSPGGLKGTRDFWCGDGYAQNMWEVKACPLYDFSKFIQDPLSCINGGGTASILDDVINGFQNLDVTQILRETIVPLAVELIWGFTIGGIIGTIRSLVCGIFAAIDAVTGLVRGITGFASDAIGGIGNAFSGFSSALGFGINRNGAENLRPCAVNHFGTCLDDPEVDCEACFRSNVTDEECGSCQTCWRPLQDQVPEMDGLCIDTTALRQMRNENSLATIQAFYIIMLSRFVQQQNFNVINRFADMISEKNVTVEELINASQGRIVESVREEGVSTRSFLEDSDGESLLSQILEETLDTKGRVDTGFSDLQDVIEETCDTGDSPRKNVRDRFLRSENDKLSDWMESDKVKETVEEHAEKLGMSKEELKEILKELMESMDSGPSSMLLDKAKEELKKDPSFLPNIEQLITKELARDPEKHANDLAGMLLENIFDPQTNLIDDQKLDNLQETLHAMQDGHRDGRVLQEGGLCGLFDSIEQTFKDFIRYVLEEIINLITSSGQENSFNLDQPEIDGAVSAAYEFSSGLTDLLLIPVGFVKTLDPFRTNSITNVVFTGLREIFGNITAIFLYGECSTRPTDPDCREQCCNDRGCSQCQLPSIRGEIIQLTEDAEGDIYLTSGCDSNFLAEMEFYKSIFSAITNLLSDAGSAVVEFLNIPLEVGKFILEILQQLFDLLVTTCADLSTAIAGATSSTIQENSRYILQEVACHNLSGNVLLKRGYGCDGIDNTCDQNFEIDECKEDIFPPDLDVTLANKECRHQIFDSEEAGVECILESTKAEDDCRPVEVSAMVVPETSGSCNPVVSVTAVAQGCGGREIEDTTTELIPIQVDAGPPMVSCAIGVQDLRGRNYPRIYTDINFSLRVSDDCSREAEVQIDVLSNELDTHVDEMVFISHGENPIISVLDYACWGERDCKISNYGKIHYPTESPTQEPTASPTSYRSKGYRRRRRQLEDLDEGFESVQEDLGYVVEDGDFEGLGYEDEDVDYEARMHARRGKGSAYRELRSREYSVQVSATDLAGNTGVTTCSTFVATDRSRECPLYPVASTNFHLPDIFVTLPSIVNIALSNEDFSTLVELVSLAGLVGVLEGDGPFTVFAPTNAAFMKLPREVVESLTDPDNVDDLVNVLTYHVVGDNIPSSALSVGAMVTALNGDTLTVTSLDPPMINESVITTVDIMASNGVIHVIDTVLIPPVTVTLPPDDCPQPPPGSICPEIYDPVVCVDNCVYDNQCLANAAGQGACNGLTSDSPRARMTLYPSNLIDD